MPDGPAPYQPAPSVELTLPMVFGRYLLLKRLSRGGMGEIFLARSGELEGFEKLFVIKRILPQLSRNPAFTDRFEDEAKISISLNHANLVPVFEVGVVGSDYFLALEYVAGLDLRRILAQTFEADEALPPELALYIAREMANGLAYAHRRTDDDGRSLRLVHCDISPPNVMISWEGEVRVIDFGVSRTATQVTREDPEVGFGKFGYMAPEQIVKGRDVDQRTDLYALGVVLYEMLVGDRMIHIGDQDSPKDIARRIVLEPPDPPSRRRPGLGKRFDALLAKATAKDPAERYQTGADLRRDLQRLLLELNPTVSSDELAAHLQQRFAESFRGERSAMREVKAADYSAWQPELTGSGESTISYAMTDAWRLSSDGDEEHWSNQIAMSDVTGPGASLTPTGPTAALLNTPTGEVARGVAAASVAVAPGVMVTTASAPAIPAPRRWWLPLVLGLAAALIVVIAIVKWPKKGDGDSSDQGAPGAAPMAPGARRTIAPMVRTTPLPSARVDAATARPARVDAAAARRAVMLPPMAWRPPPGWRPPPRPGVLLQRRVEAKFRRARGEYAGFKKRYGLRLESLWQQLLKTAVYAGAHRYQRLDRQLNALRRQMARIKKQTP